MHPLGIGGKDDPVRLVFDANLGRAVNVSLVDMGNRFRFIVNEVESVAHPDLAEPAGGARRLGVPAGLQDRLRRLDLRRGRPPHRLQLRVTTEMIEDFAAMAGVELAVIDADTELRDFKQNLRLSDLYYLLAQGLRA